MPACTTSSFEMVCSTSRTSGSGSAVMSVVSVAMLSVSVMQQAATTS